MMIIDIITLTSVLGRRAPCDNRRGRKRKDWENQENRIVEVRFTTRQPGQMRIFPLKQTKRSLLGYRNI